MPAELQEYVATTKEINEWRKSLRKFAVNFKMDYGISEFTFVLFNIFNQGNEFQIITGKRNHNCFNFATIKSHTIVARICKSTKLQRSY